jgi:hypothetical protein
MSPMRKRLRGLQCLLALVALPITCLLCLGIYFLPPVQALVGWRVDNWVTAMRRSLASEEQVLFVPRNKRAAEPIVQATCANSSPSAPVGHPLPQPLRMPRPLSISATASTTIPK